MELTLGDGVGLGGWRVEGLGVVGDGAVVAPGRRPPAAHHHRLTALRHCTPTDHDDGQGGWGRGCQDMLVGCSYQHRITLQGLPNTGSAAQQSTHAKIPSQLSPLSSTPFRQTLGYWSIHYRLETLPNKGGIGALYWTYGTHTRGTWEKRKGRCRLAGGDK